MGREELGKGPKLYSVWPKNKTIVTCRVPFEIIVKAGLNICFSRPVLGLIVKNIKGTKRTSTRHIIKEFNREL